MCWSNSVSMLKIEHAHSEKCTAIMDIYQTHSFFIYEGFQCEIHKYFRRKFSNILAYFLFSSYFIWLYNLNGDLPSCKEILKFLVCILWVGFSQVSKVLVDPCLFWNDSKCLLEWDLKPNCKALLNWTQVRVSLSQVWAYTFINAPICRCGWECQS